jgi:cyclic beta-1,2-glucan synthetase
MLVTHRRLLEWNPSIDADRAGQAGPQRIRRRLAGDVGRAHPGFGSGVASGPSTPAMLLVAAPVLLLWFVSPLFAWWISRPLARREAA